MAEDNAFIEVTTDRAPINIKSVWQSLTLTGEANVPFPPEGMDKFRGRLSTKKHRELKKDGLEPTDYVLTYTDTRDGKVFITLSKRTQFTDSEFEAEEIEDWK